MQKKWLAALCAALCGISAQAEECSYRVEAVQHAGLVAQFYRPERPGPHPAVLAFGGSEGGLQSGQASGELLAPHCIAVLALAYFRAPGLPATLDQVPLEYFVTALDHLAAQGSVDPARIGVVSGSRGSEAALWLASHDARIRSVVVATPSHSAWGGRTTEGSAWTFGGKPWPWLTPAQDSTLSQLRRFELALQDVDRVRSTRFPVERINGAVLLISAEQDQIWPSTAMSEDIARHLSQAGFKHAVRHDRYPTGHGFSQETAPRIKQSVVRHFQTTL